MDSQGWVCALTQMDCPQAPVDLSFVYVYPEEAQRVGKE